MTMTKTKTITKTFRERPQRLILETYGLWDIWSQRWGDMTWPKKMTKTMTITNNDKAIYNESKRCEGVSTNVTLESLSPLLWQSHLRLRTSFGRHSCLVLPLFQEGLLAPGISPASWRACLLLGLAWAVRGQTLVPCLKGEGESWGTSWRPSWRPANVWQRSRHLVACHPQLSFCCTSESEIFWRHQVFKHASSKVQPVNPQLRKFARNWVLFL